MVNGLQYFNSTLVRFKLANRRREKVSYSNFNSTLVRFKLKIQFDALDYHFAFQFYFSPIQTI